MNLLIENPNQQKNLEEELARSQAALLRYKRELETTNSLLEEAEELVEFTMERVETAELFAAECAEAEGRASLLQQQCRQLALEAHNLKDSLQSANQRLRMLEELEIMAEERAYSAERELQEAEQRASELEAAVLDCREGRFGRDVFLGVLEFAVRKARRYERGLAVAVFTQDNLSAEKLLSVFRESDTAANLGDGRFAVILEEDQAYEDVEESFERLRDRVGEPCSVAFFSAETGASKELLEAAESALESAR